MVTLKETLEKLNLNIELPEVQYEYPVLADYESYKYKTINNEKCVELKGYGYMEIPMVCIIHLEKKKIMEYGAYDDELNLARSMDEEGVMPFH
ncbi:MAG: hypothetical protein BZ135_08980 [Methanosphaera sp. rholeuAM6]|nr:MAG: hypothetical protein BZ135_08980 [Methanosphaera sp. rholeuAM6]